MEKDRPATLGDLTRHAEHLVSEGELAERLDEGRPLRVKLGVDPTARDITLGWAVPLRKLRAFQDAGHTAVLIMGDFTARIGDPSGKSVTRPQLDPETVAANAEACVAQLLDILSKDNLEVRYNSEWLAPLDLADILKLTSEYTVAQMLERDDFSKRYAEGRPISIVEFMYPLMQAYDSVAVEADVELGGTDQLFNLLVGRDLQRAHGQQPQIVMTMPLLVGTDGVQKMSQSLNNYIGIREAPEEIFGKVMSIPDSLGSQYATLATGMNDAAIAEVKGAFTSGGGAANAAKRSIARAVVALYHGDAAATGAEEAFDRQFKDHVAPTEVREAALPDGSVDGGKVYLPRVLAELGLAASGSEGRRLIAGGGVRIDGEPVASEEIGVDALVGAILQVGKRRFIRIVGA
ncbi:MAG TPA: tyrosine--tRNA ligase [Actinomycetota bacterium]|nr:tyrosine--tRNA ligase [Actinomycetota bacterium]